MWLASEKSYRVIKMVNIQLLVLKCNALYTIAFGKRKT